MHILVVNDDGPPSNQSSPYVHSLVKTLQDAGHNVSVCLPHTQRSWIGKAHLVGKTLTPTYYTPGTLHKDDGTTRSRPAPRGSKQPEEWILVDGTPASCVQIGLYHYFQEKGPIDLVISGPNYGRNSTAVFGLSSGTLGGALEAAVCKKKSFALSYAFDSRNHDPLIIAAGSRHSVKTIEYLYKHWDSKVDLYSINVPLVEDVEKRKVLQTDMLQNYWGPTSCFEEIEDETGDPDEEEQKIREGEEGIEQNGFAAPTRSKHKHKHFKWAPKFVDVHRSVDASEPGNDGWAVKNHYTSVTPLRANFMHALPGMEGELKLPSITQQMEQFITPEKSSSCFYAIVAYDDDYVQPLILSALESRLPEGSYAIIPSAAAISDSSKLILHIKSYEELPFEDALEHPNTCLINAYCIRKALIRKNYLLMTAHSWMIKNPSSILATNIKPSCDFELDYAEFLDDALVEAWELQASFQENEEKEPADREWWILKPGMSDRGQGIRLFSTFEELQSIFTRWEEGLPDSEDEDKDEEQEAGSEEKSAPHEAKSNHTSEDNDNDGKDYIMTSQLRHFVAQPYIHPPLLLPSFPNPASSPHKFHIRTYVLAVGSLKVYVYRPLLALFASSPYTAPWAPSSPADDINSPKSLLAHLTNTCLQDPSPSPSPSSSSPFSSGPLPTNTVHAFWSLPSTHPSLGAHWQASTFAQICSTTGEIFEAAARGMMIHFQTLPNAFEVFGLDFLVDAQGTAWLLEVNAFPDFRQTGGELKGLVKGLWEGVVDVAVGKFFGVEGSGEGSGEGRKKGEGKGDDGRRCEGDMVLVRELDLGRR